MDLKKQNKRNAINNFLSWLALTVESLKYKEYRRIRLLSEVYNVNGLEQRT